MFKETKEILELLIVAALSIVILKTYFEIFFQKKTKAGSYQKIFVIYFLWQVLMGKFINFPGYINIIISIVITYIICICEYEGVKIQKIIFSVLINTIWMLMEFFVGYAFLLCNIDYKLPRFWGSISSELLTLVFILILRNFFYNENIKNLSNKHNTILLLIPMGSMLVVYNIFNMSVKIEEKYYIKEALINSVIILILNIIVFKLYLNLSKEKELQKYNTVYKQQLELCNQHMIEKETVMMEARKNNHDLKQHFILLMELIDKQNSTAAIAYLQKLINIQVFTNNGICRTNNIVVDSLVNAKYAMAVKNNIKFECDIHIPVQLPFENADICIILGNIIDNAIEATELLAEDKRKINFYMRYEKGVLIITVVNNYNGKIKRNKNGKIISHKKDWINHGIGLESVKNIANKYNGSTVLDITETRFIIKIMLCKPE